MKRRLQQDLSSAQFRESIVWPNELIYAFLSDALPREITQLFQFKRLLELGLVSPQFRQVLSRECLPRIASIAPSILAKVPLGTLVLCTGLLRIDLTGLPGDFLAPSLQRVESVRIDCKFAGNDWLSELPALTDLTLLVSGVGDSFPMQKFTAIKRLEIVMGKDVRKRDLRTLHLMSSLVVLALPEAITIPDSDNLTSLLSLRELRPGWNNFPLPLLARLHTLDLSRGINLIRDPTLSQLTQLTSLNLAYNHYVSARGLSPLTALTSLDLCNTGELPNQAEIWRFTLLRQLELNNTYAKKRCYAKLTSLTRLSLPSANAQEPKLSRLTNLTSLALHKWAKCTADTFAGLTRLQFLIAPLRQSRPGRPSEKVGVDFVRSFPCLRHLILPVKNMLTDAGRKQLGGRGGEVMRIDDYFKAQEAASSLF